MAQVEPMDIDSVGSDFDDKENSLLNSNVLPTPCTEKGYEELDVSELNMKLRYSITPASSPMSKSFTSCKDNKTYSLNEDSLNNTLVNNTNLTRSLNSSIVKCDISKSPKLPLQALPTDQYLDINSTVRRSLDNDPNNITITLNGTENIDENLSLPSTASSAVQTPEATTPTKEIPKDGGSPIMRGLKSVLNMFRSSQSPIPPEEIPDKKEPTEPRLEEESQNKLETVLASTPKTNRKNKDNNSSKRSSPLKESVTFNDDLERELQWREDSTIIFKQEKIPIHKLFLQQSTSLAIDKKIPLKLNETQLLNSTVEYMDISYNESGIADKTMTEIDSIVNNIEVATGVESDTEFLDCESTYTKNEQTDSEQLNRTIPVNMEKNDLTQEVPIDNITSQIDEHVVAYIDKDTEGISTNLSGFETNEQIEEHHSINNESRALNDVLCTNVNEPIITEVPSEIQQLECVKDEIHINREINVITVSDVSADKSQSNEKDPSLILDQSNLVNSNVSTTDFVNDNLSNTFNTTLNEIMDSKNVKQMTFDVTMPLNIVTDDHANYVVNENASNNIEVIDKEHVELNEKHAPPSSSRILQICENVSGTVHDHASNTFNVFESTFNIEENQTEKNIENNVIPNHSVENSQETNLTAFISNDKLNEKSTCNNIDIQTLEHDIIEQFSLEQITNAPTSNNQPDFKNNIGTLNNDEFQNNVEELTENLPNIINIDQNKLQNIEEDAKLDKPPLSEFINDLPSDIPLPSDDDIEKDSLMDNFVINNDNDIEELDIKTLDSLETMDVYSQKTVTTNFEHLNDINNILPATNTPLANLDHIQSNIQSITENISNSSLSYDILINRTEISVELPNQNNFLPTSECEILSKTESIRESVSMDIVDDKTILPNTISELNQHQQYSNNIESLNDKISASLAGHVECQTISNDSPISNAEDIKSNENISNTINEECEKNNLNEECRAIVMDTKKLEHNKVEVLSSEHINDTPILCKSNILNDVSELKENKILDEEIVTSANNSPYVSVNDLDLNIPISENKLDEVESPFESKSKIAMSPPGSPQLIRKGYNINFDEIDDPFATKTNIRMSPPPETSPKSTSALINQKKPDIQKRVQQQIRRKSQPERPKRDLTKKRLNSSYSCDTRNSKFKEQINPSINENDSNKLIQDVKKIDQNFTTITPVIEADNLETIDTKSHDVESFDISNKNVLNYEETIKEEIQSPNVETTDNNSSILNPVATNIPAIKCPPRNVFNLPEIDDINFNPFVLKSKIRNSPSPTSEDEKTILKDEEKENTTSGPSFEMSQPIENLTLNVEQNSKENKFESDKSSENCSSKDTDRDITMQEVATEDEDTGEAPFLEAEEFADVVKVSDFGSETDMMQFEDMRSNVTNENKDEGELFIDAEAFEFLLNQNKSNTVADSGKESLFLKFDPLFAKRVSSDGVLAALSRIQRRQSTPKKAPETTNRNNMIDEAIPSVSSTKVDPVIEESYEESNVTITKPMMVVNPAINSLVSPRKSTTPPRINRRSLTFTSPAMAVIDRLLSLSGNSSTLEHETSLPRTNREYDETDIALTQLRELLAEKEIHVHNLRSESKELKERLATMESQVKALEKESEERLKKVNDLNDRLTEKSKINKSMAVVVEEYERTIASLIAEMEQEKRRNAGERAKIISERDEQTAHLASMEVSFSDLHSKYEKSKQIILSMKANEDTYKKSMKEFEDNLLKMQNNYELLKQHATSKLNHANQELEKFNRAHESEVLKLNAMIKRRELHITSLEESLAQKTKANEELTAICDELINKVG